jgi:hypothetical protein
LHFHLIQIYLTCEVQTVFCNLENYHCKTDHEEFRDIVVAYFLLPYDLPCAGLKQKGDLTALKLAWNAYNSRTAAQVIAVLV